MRKKKTVKPVRQQTVREVISVRVTDDEMEDIERLMKMTKRNATALLREAFALLCEEKYKWAVPRTEETDDLQLAV